VDGLEPVALTAPDEGDEGDRQRELPEVQRRDAEVGEGPPQERVSGEHERQRPEEHVADPVADQDDADDRDRNADDERRDDRVERRADPERDRREDERRGSRRRARGRRPRARAGAAPGRDRVWRWRAPGSRLRRSGRDAAHGGGPAFLEIGGRRV
jgi:hypothetical protein